MQAGAWVSIAATLAVSLGLDLFAHRGGRETSIRSATLWTVAWLALGAAFGLVVLALRGGAAAQDYYAAYLIEESLSIDNLFVFLLIFKALRIPEERQHRVLFFGVLGALILRGLFVFVGAAALERWSWVNFVFGGALLLAAVRAATSDPGAGESAIVHWLSRHLPVSTADVGPHFIVREGGRRLITPLLLALIGLELTDLLFAIDSVPAALSVSRDRFVVYASNALAICGLRSLYLVLHKGLRNLPHLHYGIAAVLLFTAFKLISEPWLKLPSWLSIIVTIGCIGASVLASLRARRSAEAPAS